MNISGVLVHSRPETSAAVKQRLLAFDGVEVHAIADNGKIIVTVEEKDSRQMADTVMDIQNVEGVISAALIYHHYEDDALLDEPVETTPLKNEASKDSGLEEAAK